MIRASSAFTLSFSLLATAAGCSGDHAGAVLPPVTIKSEAEEPVATGRRLQLVVNEAQGNSAAWQILGPGLVETAFELRPDAAGTFFLTDPRVAAAACAAKDLDVRWHVGFLDQGAQIKLLHRIDPYEVLRLRAYQSIILVASTVAPAACGDTTVTFTARFVGRRGESTSSNTQDGDDVGPASDDGGNPDGGTDDPLPPTTCDALSAADTPHGGFTLVGQTHAREACRDTFTWRLADHVAPSPLNGCKPPVVKFTASEVVPEIKIQEARNGLNHNLAWIRLRDLADRDQVLAGLKRGEDVRMAAVTGPLGERACSDGGTALPAIERDFDLVLFRGDPREACLAKGGASRYVELTSPATALRVDYAYGDAATPATFHWRARLQAAAVGLDANGTYKARLYHLRTRTFVTGWQPLQKSAGTFTLSVEAPSELRAIMAEQRDLDLLIAEMANEDAAQCNKLWIVPYGGIFANRSLAGAFHDATEPGRDRLTISSDDLP